MVICDSSNVDEGHEVELGAQWVHGDVRNPLYDLCMKHDLITYKGDRLDEYKADDEGQFSIIVTLFCICTFYICHIIHSFL